MLVQMLLGYPYSVFRPVISVTVLTLALWRFLGSPFVRTVIWMARLPYASVPSSAKAETAPPPSGGWRFTTLSAMSRQSETMPSLCQLTLHDRRSSRDRPNESTGVMRHWTHWFPGFRVLAFVCV